MKRRNPAGSNYLVTKLGKSFEVASIFSAVLALYCSTANAQSSTQIADQAIELSGYSVSESFDVEDDLPLDPEDRFLRRLLHRVGQTSAGNLNRYGAYAADIDWPELKKSPHDYRFWVFQRDVFLSQVHRIDFSDAVDDESLSGCYVNYCQTADGDPVIVLTRSTCRRWPLETALPDPQPVRVSGFFYGAVLWRDGELIVRASGDETEPVDDVAPVPVFIADRLAWFPDSASEALDVSPDHVLLARHGVDIGLLDYVRAANSKPLGTRDAGSFYQLLAAVAEIGESLPVDSRQFVDLMTTPMESIGDSVTLRGVVRQCVEVKLTDAAAQAATGVDRYWQLSLFPDLGGRRISLKRPDGELDVFTSFPATVCLTKLPGGETMATMEGQQLQVDGFYFRFWRYASERSQQTGSGGQVSPLVIAASSKILPAPVNALNWVAGAGMGLLLLAVLAAWYFTRSTTRPTDRRHAYDPQDMPETIDVSGIEDRAAN